MTESTPSLPRGVTSVVSKSIGRRRGQRVSATESIDTVLLTAVFSASALVAAATHWWLRRRR